MTTRCRLDTTALYQSLELELTAGGHSWRWLARQTGLSPSTFSRLRNGTAPSAHALVTLLWWLNHQVGGYITNTPEWTA